MSEPAENTESQNNRVTDDLTLQLASLLRNSLNLSQPQNSESLNIGFKLNRDNYPLWSVLMKNAIGGRGKASYIIGDTPAPSLIDSTYTRWEQEDQCVFTWLVQNIEPSLVNSVSKHSTSKAVWESLALTYGSGADSLQVFDLHRRANSIRQDGKTLEKTWAQLQDVWMSIDRKEPNPMKCPTDIDIYNRTIQTQRVYQFLMALEEGYEPVKKEILKWEPLPSVETAYVMVRRETARDRILRPVVTEEKGTSSSIGLGLAARDRPNKGQSSYKGKPRQSNDDKNKLICEHCGLKRLTKESCFHLIGFPEWWDESKKPKQPQQHQNRGGTVTVAMTADWATSTGAGNTSAMEAAVEYGVAAAHKVEAARAGCDPEVLATSVYLLNRLPTKALQFQTPLQALSEHAHVPVALTLPPKVFGCSVFVHLPKQNRDKFSPCAVKCVFVGYGIHQKGYRCYDPQTRRMFTTMNCDFLEGEYFFHHLRRQGESREPRDSISWLTTPMSNSESESGPSSTEKVNSAAEISSDTAEQSTDFGVHVPETSSPHLISEVRDSVDMCNSDSSLETNDRAGSGEEETDSDTTIDNEGVEASTEVGRYVLPPISTRGMPPKRYSPEHIGKKSRYSVENYATSHLTGMAQAFEMVKVKKTYKARFVVDFSELGESDPLLLNATLFHELQNMPWYPSGILKGERATYFSKKIEVPDGQTLDIIALDTVLLQNQSSVRGNDQIVWLMRILNESISDWKVVVGLHQLISSDCNIWETNETRFAPLQNILLQYGVDVYMSTETCDDNTTTTTTRGNGNEAIYLTAVNHNLVSKEETMGGFLLHRVSSLEMVTLVVKLTGEVEHRLSFQQRGRAAM
ncbi:hypothetical protein C2S53_020534 [Perilla frutescens var. hirtella]|uniref:Uncharacterized protein n=1 Tax=Perilla frutescens var. hirtella TaxID=608512 RepID=A0AAD4J5I9_PERFH|nr:hypothetical protein C2S53_020534 [Perilla frutescens var. hirtella]